METKKCIKCCMEIHPLRLKAIPNTKTCVSCSDTQKVGCHQIISGKNTYSEIQIMDQSRAMEMKRMQSRMGYGVSTGVRFKFDHKRN